MRALRAAHRIPAAALLTILVLLCPPAARPARAQTTEADVSVTLQLGLAYFAQQHYSSPGLLRVDRERARKESDGR